MDFKPKPTKRQRDYKYHIVLSFEDNDETYYVVKYYGIYKQWWHYEIWDSYSMILNKKNGYKIVKHRTGAKEKAFTAKVVHICGGAIVSFPSKEPADYLRANFKNNEKVKIIIRQDNE